MRIKKINKFRAIKVFDGDKRLKDIYPYATKWQVCKYKFMCGVKFVCKCVIGLIVIAIICLVVRELYPKTVVNIKEVNVEVESKAPIMDRIAKCESNNTHFREGQVLVMGNTDRSVDIGVYQINNKVWGKIASDKGYNLMIEKDNRAFAQWIYKNYGTEPWVHSKKCWR